MATEYSLAGSITLPAQTLADFGRGLLGSLGVVEAHACLISDSLVAANLRGVDSHGVQMLTTYIAQLRAGSISARAAGRVVVENGACLTYDGENGLGQVVADRCVDHVIRLAPGSGLAMVVAHNSNHFGAGAFWGERIARAGLIGITMSNACPAVAPWQGRTPILGTNPICVAVPSNGSGRWLLDMATTTVALGKVGHAANLSQPVIPAAWGFLDADGKPTTDTQAALHGAPTPTGGYKGSGLAVMVEILCAVLGGGGMATELPIFRTGGAPLGISQTFLAIDPRRFLPAGEFEDRMDRLANMVKSAAPAPGYDEVLIAGEPEWRCEAERRRTGISVPAKLWTRLCLLASELNVTPPVPT